MQSPSMEASNTQQEKAIWAEDSGDLALSRRLDQRPPEVPFPPSDLVLQNGWAYLSIKWKWFHILTERGCPCPVHERDGHQHLSGHQHHCNQDLAQHTSNKPQRGRGKTHPPPPLSSASCSAQHCCWLLKHRSLGGLYCVWKEKAWFPRISSRTCHLFRKSFGGISHLQLSAKLFQDSLNSQ